jgi:hypothetical protein
MNLRDVRIGDKVRLTVEGEVNDLERSIVQVNGTWYAAEHYNDVEILERAKPKVGDVIKNRRELAKLSNGTVVKNASDRALVIRDGYTLSARTGFAASLSDDRIIEDGPYVVIHVPPAQR